MKSIRKRMVIHYCIIILLVVLVLEGLFITAVRQYYYGSVEQILVNRAAVSSAVFNKYLPEYSTHNDIREKARIILENVSGESAARVDVVDRTGSIIIDSNGFSPRKKVETPDFYTALHGKTGIWHGKNKLTNETVMAVSNPLKEGNKIIGVLRYISSMEAVNSTVNRIIVIALFVGLLVILLILTFSLLLANSIVKPIQNVTSAAGQMAEGDFSVRASKKYEDEIGQLADTLNYMASEIIKAEKVKNDFLSSISHELRTPLTSIKGWCETLHSGDLTDNQETREGLQIISKETDRLTGLVEDLLDYSRLQAGRIEIKPRIVNINKVIKEVVQQFSVRVKEKSIDIITDLDCDLVQINADYNRIKQVLIILLDNSIKFTPSNGTIYITTGQKNNYVELEMIDNGQGIDIVDIERITEKFYKADYKSSGSGLGLSIAKKIISIHGGKLDFYSAPGHGTKVKIRLKNLTG
ncbi:MAG: HAMP domain-containing histidine kinase [Clostridiales bacterium]|nr:HAMP domain-containing histidine kinase [Clostridiales bacterium]MCF8021266.1 HAMP domain-containing histidine kinase [Clostridiales bacterium]